MNVWLKTSSARRRSSTPYTSSSSLGLASSVASSSLPIITQDHNLNDSVDSQAGIVSPVPSIHSFEHYHQMISIESLFVEQQFESEQIQEPKDQVRYNGTSNRHTQQNQTISTHKLKSQGIGTSRVKTPMNSINTFSSNSNPKHTNYRPSYDSRISSKNPMKPSNSLGRTAWTTGRRNDLHEHVISVIQYCSNEVGLAIYNLSSGEIHLAQIVERITYFRTISTLQRYYPRQIIYSQSLECTLLVRKLIQHFKNTTFRAARRTRFDETKGYFIYQQRGNAYQSHPNNKFLAFAALHALILHVEETQEWKLEYSALKIKWHLLQEVLVIESQAIMELEIFMNSNTRMALDSFIENFKCSTYGGTRMLRANLLQPLLNINLIQLRQNLTERLLHDKALYDSLQKQLPKFKCYDPITAKFIQSPKQQNLRSLKTYLSAIYSLSHLCQLLDQLALKLSPYFLEELPHISRLLTLIKHPKMAQIRLIIIDNFQENMLDNYKEKVGKKDKFIFLFKIGKMEDEFAQISRYTYTQTTQDIHHLFQQIKRKSKKDIKLLYNEARGYFLQSKNRFNIKQFAQQIDDNVHILINTEKPNFTTSMLDSLNNRLRQNERRLILQSESVLRKVVAHIQLNIDVLFDIDEQLSLLDMIVSFAQFVKRYVSVTFCKPNLTSIPITIKNMHTVWTSEKYSKSSEGINVDLDPNAPIIVIPKKANSIYQRGILNSMAYMILLGQIGCFVPAESFSFCPFETMFTKIGSTQNDLQTNLSHFQHEMVRFKNIFDNSLESHGRSVVLMDELVKGTQYEQQIALSLATLEHLTARKGVSFVLLSDQFLFKRALHVFPSIQALLTPNDTADTNKQILSSLDQLDFSDQFLADFEALTIQK